MTQPLFDPKVLAGRHALVGGASSGIGRATAILLGRMGARVAMIARSPEALDAAAAEVRAAGAPEVHTLVADHTDRPDLVKKVEAHLAAHGPLHIMVNNSGGPAAGPILEAKEEDFMRVFGQHVMAAHQLLKIVLPGMRAAGFGRFVNVISTSVYEPIPGLGISNTVRAAMAGWAKTVANELPPGITMNNVLPGATKTPRLDSLAQGRAGREGTSVDAVFDAWTAVIPEKRIADAGELAAVIGFLCSPAAGYVRGVSIPVDGGRHHAI